MTDALPEHSDRPISNVLPCTGYPGNAAASLHVKPALIDSGSASLRPTQFSYLNHGHVFIAETVPHRRCIQAVPPSYDSMEVVNQDTMSPTAPRCPCSSPTYISTHKFTLLDPAPLAPSCSRSHLQHQAAIQNHA